MKLPNMCETCNVAVTEIKGRNGPYLINPDGSYHIVFAKGQKFHSISEKHQEYIIKNGTSEGFGKSTGIQKIGDIPKPEEEKPRSLLIDVNDETIKSKLIVFKSILKDFDIIDFAVRDHLKETGEANPNPAKIGMMIKYVQDEWNRQL